MREPTPKDNAQANALDAARVHFRSYEELGQILGVSKWSILQWRGGARMPKTAKTLCRMLADPLTRELVLKASALEAGR